MRVDSVNYSRINSSPINHDVKVADAEDIKLILFLGIKSDIPIKDSKRKVDIIV